MNHRIRATFHAGAFVPDQPCELPEGANVDLLIGARSHQRYSVSFGANAVAKKFRRQEVPEEIKTVLSAIKLGHSFV